MIDQPEEPSSPDDKLKPKELIITALVILSLIGAVWGFTAWSSNNSIESLKTAGQEVEAVVVDKEMESKARRPAGVTVRIYYQFELNGNSEQVVVQSGSLYDYGTINIGDTVVLCVDPENLDNVQVGFEDCFTKIL